VAHSNCGDHRESARRHGAAGVFWRGLAAGAPTGWARDQFVLTLSTDRAEDLFSEVNRRNADPRVAWAEPNFLSQAVKQSDDPYFHSSGT